LQKKPEEYALEYAGFWLRLTAFLLDILIIFLLVFFLTNLFSSNLEGLTRSLLPTIIYCLIVLIMNMVYFVTFWVWRGQTLGMMIMGIKVIRTDSSELDWHHASLRFGAGILCILTLFLGFIVIAFDAKKQGLHDKIADTYVVKLPVRQVVFTNSYLRS
jgi:uncharacterized RDD family membrane protein YckC